MKEEYAKIALIPGTEFEATNGGSYKVLGCNRHGEYFVNRVADGWTMKIVDPMKREEDGYICWAYSIGGKFGIRKGKYIQTPRFLNVRIADILTKEEARKQGFKEPTHYDSDPDFDVFGKSTGENKMLFAAVLKDYAV